MIAYNAVYHSAMLEMLNSFHRHHQGLVLGKEKEVDIKEADLDKQINEFVSNDRLYIIADENTPVGYMHIAHKEGDMVAFLKDIFVKAERRGSGYASFAIEWMESEYKCKAKAISMDVTLRNIDAMKIYYKLGYDSISMITLRKEINGENPRDKKLEFAGMEFNV